MSEIKTWGMRAGKRWPEASEIIEAMQAEIDRLRTEAVAADIRIGNDALVIAELRAERDALARCKLADQAAYVAMRDQRDALQAKLAALEKQEPVALLAQGISKGVVGATKLYFPQERQEAFEFCTAAHEKGGYPVTEIRPLYAAAGATPVPEDWRSAVAMAYGHLWHINNEPMDPIPLRSEESASYAARKLLRDLLTTKERGEAINSVGAMLAAAPKEQA